MNSTIEDALYLTNEALGLFQMDETEIQIHLSPLYYEGLGGRIDYAAHPYQDDLELDLREMDGKELSEELSGITPLIRQHWTFGGYGAEQFEEEYKNWITSFRHNHPKTHLNYIDGYEI